MAFRERDKKLPSGQDPLLKDRAIRHLTAAVTTDSRSFAEVDHDGDQKLDFEEFLSMQPDKILHDFGVNVIREWFDQADLDGDGTLSVNEFFQFALSNASQEHGSESIRYVFEKYDRDHKGHLDAIEWQQVCKDLGFGSVASEIFEALDEDGSGTISYDELIDSFKTRPPPSDPETKAMLTTLACSTYSAKRQETQDVERRMDTTGWCIRGRTYSGVRSELQALLMKSGGQVSDLLRVFDEDHKLMETSEVTGALYLSIDEGEFIRTMRDKLGFCGKPHVLNELFHSLDSDRSGQIGFDELYEFIRGKRHSLDHRGMPALDMVLRPPDHVRLDDLVWDSEVLRCLLADMLE